MQLALSRGIAESVAGTGVTANAVLPGPTRSEGVEEFVGKLADDQGADLENFKRDSAAITGASLRVDGGVVCSIV